MIGNAKKILEVLSLMIIIRHELWNIFKGSSYEFKILLGIFDVFLFVCSKDKHTAGGLWV
jgi:hypothetical protein